MRIAILTIIFLLGSLIGAILLYLSNLLINSKEKANASVNHAISQVVKDRTENISFKGFCSTIVKNRINTILFMTINGICWTCAIAIAGMSLQAIQIMLVVSSALLISIIDIKIRIIPNEVVLLIFISSLVFAFASSKYQTILPHLIGLLIGIAFFCIPFLLKSNLGGGDIKYIAVMGFCLGFPDIVKAMMILSSVLLIWLIYLIISKRGGLKTKFAMGPFISIGFVATLFFQR